MSEHVINVIKGVKRSHPLGLDCDCVTCVTPKKHNRIEIGMRTRDEAPRDDKKIPRLRLGAVLKNRTVN